MNKKEYKKLIGESPEDMFGADYENILTEMLEVENIPVVKIISVNEFVKGIKAK